jgi:hypothetical protein
MLLAGLAAKEIQDSPAETRDMDPDLAALLADL